jgi:hypothetical protein
VGRLERVADERATTRRDETKSGQLQLFYGLTASLPPSTAPLPSGVQVLNTAPRSGAWLKSTQAGSDNTASASCDALPSVSLCHRTSHREEDRDQASESGPAPSPAPVPDPQLFRPSLGGRDRRVVRLSSALIARVRLILILAAKGKEAFSRQ